MKSWITLSRRSWDGGGQGGDDAETATAIQTNHHQITLNIHISKYTKIGINIVR